MSLHFFANPRTIEETHSRNNVSFSNVYVIPKIAMLIQLSPALDHQPLHHLLRHLCPARAQLHQRPQHDPHVCGNERRARGQHLR